MLPGILCGGGMTVGRLTNRKKWLFCLVAFVSFFAAVEVVLRVAGFEYYDFVRYMHFFFEGGGIPSGGFVSGADENNTVLYILHKKDPVLFWRNVPGFGPVNVQGFVNSTGRLYTTAKSKGVYRIVCLGCSCTNRGWLTYPERLEKRLNEGKNSETTFEVINAGVGGYSSYQGLLYFADELIDYTPDVVTVYFGWNDHWRAIHYPDKAQPNPGEFWVQLQNILNRMRIYQFLHKVIETLAVKDDGDQRDSFRPRVSLRDYRENLEAIVGTARTHGSRVLLMTAPQALSAESIAAYQDMGVIPDQVDLIRLHAAYNDVVRGIAASHRVLLVDLARMFAAIPEPRSYFMPDGVHHREQGLQIIADALVEAMREHGLVPGGCAD
jgi:lysophospholipase L1-like esterase